MDGFEEAMTDRNLEEKKIEKPDGEWVTGNSCKNRELLSYTNISPNLSI